ncbi:MAG: putative polyprenyl diphosphate synthase [Acidobacteria bacterium]|nr:putative polyprenyl diphosphate synthase [Acidobacteriota bacterium]
MDRPVVRDLIPIERVWTRLEAVEEGLRRATTSSDPFLTRIAQHLLAAGGKRYRPLLAQVAAELGGRPGEGPVAAGVAVELVHLGSLYHDDVIDQADSRRGVVSVNADWSNTVAILAGDFLLARASETAAPLGIEAVTLLARTYGDLCEGQIGELQLTGDTGQGRSGYERVIRLKTASLIRTSARLGAMAGGASPEATEAASRWAHEVGMAFQITDDLLDLVATEEFLGKPAGSDIGEGTFTLPVLFALEGPDGDEVRRLLAGGCPYPPEAVERVIELARSRGHVDRALEVAREHTAAASAALAGLPPGPVAGVLRTLGEYIIGRVEDARR